MAQRTAQAQTNAWRHPHSCECISDRKLSMTVHKCAGSKWKRESKWGGKEKEIRRDTARGDLFFCLQQSQTVSPCNFFTLFHQLLSSMSWGNTLGWLVNTRTAQCSCFNNEYAYDLLSKHNNLFFRTVMGVAQAVERTGLLTDATLATGATTEVYRMSLHYNLSLFNFRTAHFLQSLSSVANEKALTTTACTH